jgi:hypothetical protein
MLPPGMNAERIHAGITLALKQMAERGWHADLCLLRPNETAGPDVERRLKAQTYDCVVIGAGIRLPPHSLSMFEAVINAVQEPRRTPLSRSTRALRTASMLPPAGSRRTEQQGRASIDARADTHPVSPTASPIWRLVRLHGHGKGGAGPTTRCRPSDAAVRAAWRRSRPSAVPRPGTPPPLRQRLAADRALPRSRSTRALDR